MKYPARFEAEESGYVVTFRDVPEAMTQGDDDAEAEFMAQDVLRAAIRVYFDQRRPVPLPSQIQRGERMVAVPPATAAKVLLLNEMLQQNISIAQLAERLGTTTQEIEALIDPSQTASIDRIAQALGAMDRELNLVLE